MAHTIMSVLQAFNYVMNQLAPFIVIGMLLYALIVRDKAYRKRIERIEENLSLALDVHEAHFKLHRDEALRRNWRAN